MISSSVLRLYCVLQVPVVARIVVVAGKLRMVLRRQIFLHFGADDFPV